MDPRIERTRRAVLHATLVVLGRRGYAAFTVEAVAAEAGVAKSTIYRHWPTRIALVADSLETLNRQPGSDAVGPEARRPGPEVDVGSARDEIRALMAHLAEAFSDSLVAACVPALIEAAEHHPEVASFLHGYSARRRQRLVDAVQRGIDAGQLRPDLDPELAALSLAGPIVYRRTMTPEPMTVDEATRLVDQLLGP